ncbi:MAG: hypothetical protein IJM97_03540 [Clostridia bacterium]|nr:hypothetical protein [Clostridia bacterium]
MKYIVNLNGKNYEVEVEETEAVITGVADAVVVFWDGKSRGSKSMINCAKEQGITCKVVRY